MLAVETPRWIRRVVGYGFAALLILIAAAAAALRAGAADQRELRNRMWRTEFAPNTASDWQIIADAGVTANFGDGGLVLALPNAGTQALMLRARAVGAWTLVVDAAQTAGAAGAMHGVAFNCVSETACSYMLLNNNGYVEVFRQTGSERTVWLELQQWPHVRRGSATNRVQLSAAAGSVEVRVNDELLLRVPVLPGGLVGLAVHARATAQSVTYALAELRTEQ